MILTEVTCSTNPALLGVSSLQGCACHMCLTYMHSWIDGLWYLGKMQMIREVLLVIATSFVITIHEAWCLIRRDGKQVCALSFLYCTFLARVDPTYRFLQ